MVKIRITEKLPAGLEVRPEVGAVYEAAYKLTPPPAPRMAYYIHTGPDRKGVWVFPGECAEVSE